MGQLALRLYDKIDYLIFNRLPIDKKWSFKIYKLEIFKKLIFSETSSASMKIWIFFLLLLAAVSFDEAAIVEKNSEGTLDLTSGLTALIGQMLASVQASLQELVLQTESLIQSALTEIDNTISNLEAAFKVYLQEVKDQIEKLVNEELLPCLEEALSKIDGVLEETTAGIQNCREIAVENLSTIRKDVEYYKQANQATFEGVSSFVDACISLHDLGDKIKCLVDASRNVSSSVAAFRENLTHFLTVVDEKVSQVVVDVKECVNAEVVAAQQAVSEIIEAAEKCVGGEH